MRAPAHTRTRAHPLAHSLSGPDFILYARAQAPQRSDHLHWTARFVYIVCDRRPRSIRRRIAPSLNPKPQGTREFMRPLTATFTCPEFSFAAWVEVLSDSSNVDRIPLLRKPMRTDTSLTCWGWFHAPEFRFGAHGEDCYIVYTTLDNIIQHHIAI